MAWEYKMNGNTEQHGKEWVHDCGLGIQDEWQYRATQEGMGT